VHRAEGHCLLERQAPNNENPLRLLAGTQRLKFYNNNNNNTNLALWTLKKENILKYLG
jgi:hypothetical protein